MSEPATTALFEREMGASFVYALTAKWFMHTRFRFTKNNQTYESCLLLDHDNESNLWFM